ncbi:hypothetical protein TI10_04005 [Photorhabdus luminescens subsp. luminescens]|uniref:Uncharacterized protein n=1 Tax=Photorhabdus luminescens TaxID=29488 RepID=A0A1G5R2B8_PHOLU|nr:hypothetical protein [Photorhabdus luminescens]KMW74916.1 hypothetical protein TI10_04005 [Photorhabdus luminescens subsp. luminescens]SCZ68096.1 hypothetical protein SAMN02982990_02855 [Photorhabdus luminescens]
MLNIKNKKNNITPQLVYLWKKNHNLWGAKHCQSKFIYANSFFCQPLNLSENFDITELSASELPAPITEYEDSQRCIGTLFHVNKTKVFSLTCRFYGKLLATIIGQTPSKLFTQVKHAIIFLFLQKYTNQKPEGYRCLNDFELNAPEKLSQQESIMFS